MLYEENYVVRHSLVKDSKPTIVVLTYTNPEWSHEVKTVKEKNAEWEDEELDENERVTEKETFKFPC